MKKIVSIVLLLLLNLSFAQTKWMTIEEALKAQKENPKKILIDFYADWCGPCKIMDKKTYGHPILSQILNENFYPVKFNAEEKKSLEIFGRTFSNPNTEHKKDEILYMNLLNI